MPNSIICSEMAKLFFYFTIYISEQSTHSVFVTIIIIFRWHGIWIMAGRQTDKEQALSHSKFSVFAFHLTEKNIKSKTIRVNYKGSTMDVNNPCNRLQSIFSALLFSSFFKLVLRKPIIRNHSRPLHQVRGQARTSMYEKTCTMV